MPRPLFIVIFFLFHEVTVMLSCLISNLLNLLCVLQVWIVFPCHQHECLLEGAEARTLQQERRITRWGGGIEEWGIEKKREWGMWWLPEQLDWSCDMKMVGRITRWKKRKRDDRAEGVKSIDIGTWENMTEKKDKLGWVGSVWERKERQELIVKVAVRQKDEKMEGVRELRGVWVV